MLIIPYVCADFRDKKGNPIFRITADMLRTMQDVPEAIKQDLLFDMLVQDGSIKTPENGGPAETPGAGSHDRDECRRKSREGCKG